MLLRTELRSWLTSGLILHQGLLWKMLIQDGIKTLSSAHLSSVAPLQKYFYLTQTLL